MSILFVAIGSLKHQNGYIIRISEEAKLVTSTHSYLSIFVPFREYMEHLFGIKFPVMSLLSEVFDSIYIFPSISGIYAYSYKNWRLQRLIRLRNIDYIHAESTACGYILGRSKNPLIFTLDLHGFSEYETILRSSIKNRNWLFAKLALKRAQKFDRVSILSANKIIAVSESMKQHLNQKYNIDFSKISVTPCLASTTTIINSKHEWRNARQILRNNINVEDSTTVIGYIGGLGVYQMVQEMLNFFHSYYSINNNSIFLLVVVGNSSELTNIIERRNMSHMVKIFKDIPHDEVKKYLCAMDAGLLFRKNDPVNYYASPTKFGEYLSCGVPVIASSNIGDLQSYINSSKLGIGIDDKFTVDQRLCDSLDNIMKNRSIIAMQNVDWVSNQYSWNSKSLYFPAVNE